MRAPRGTGRALVLPRILCSRPRAAADVVAAFVGAPADELVLVTNITFSTNAVLGALRFALGDARA